MSSGMSSDTSDILQKVASGQLTVDQAQQLLSKSSKPTVTYKVSPKGAISFYGIRKFPITLYVAEVEQLTEIFSSPQFKQFLVDNQDKLTRK